MLGGEGGRGAAAGWALAMDALGTRAREKQKEAFHRDSLQLWSRVKDLHTSTCGGKKVKIPKFDVFLFSLEWSRSGVCNTAGGQCD